MQDYIKKKIYPLTERKHMYYEKTIAIIRMYLTLCLTKFFTLIFLINQHIIIFINIKS